MFISLRVGLRCAALCTLVMLGSLGVAGGQEKKLKELQWSHAFDLACRKLGQTEFTKESPVWGVEAFRDNNTGLGLYISQTGSIAVAPNFAGLTVPVKPSQGAKFVTGLDLPTRKAGKIDWMDKSSTKVHSMEVRRDPNTDDWLLITERGNIASTTGKLFPGAANKIPKWVHSVDLSVRKGGVKEWKDAPKFGLEVYSDGNTGNLVYVTEHGNVAIIPEIKEIPVGKGKAPEWLHGLDLKCRKFDEKAFSKDTRNFGVEVYNDLTTGNLIFISETGSIAVTAAPAQVKAPTPKAKEPVWTHGLNVKCRHYGEKEFSDATRSFGAEVFHDDNVGATIYINELGNISVLSAK